MRVTIFAMKLSNADFVPLVVSEMQKKSRQK